MKVGEERDAEEVIDAARWLESRVEQLVLAERYEEAIASLRWLATSTLDKEEARRAAMSLGYLYLLVEEWERAREWLLQVLELGETGDQPDLLYGLGHAALGQKAQGSAMLYFLEAFVEAKEEHQQAECLRSAALAMMETVGPAAPVAGMVLGALDRDLGNPWILEALVKVYRADERWLESLEVLAALRDTVEEAHQSVVLYRPASGCQVLRNRLLGRAAQPEDVKKQAREINARLRAGFEVVLDARQLHTGPTGLAPAYRSGAVGRLILSLEVRERGLELVESARKLWALASHEGFVEILGAVRLAAAIEVLVERQHWRVKTSVETIARRHGALPEAVGPAARLVAGRLGLNLFGATKLRERLAFGEQKRLDGINQALLFGESLEDARRGAIRLG